MEEILVKISDIEIENKLTLKFIYKEKEFRMLVDVIKQEKDYIVITAILENDTILDPETMSNVEVVSIVKDGLYTYKTCKLTAIECNGMRSYAITCDDDVSKDNRREYFRVFVGEIGKISITSIDGSKIEMEGIIKDISINGMGVILNREIKIGSKMSVIYNFEGLNIHLLGEVIRAEKVPGRKYFSYGCKFYSSNPLVNRVIILKQMRNKQRQVLESE